MNFLKLYVGDYMRDTGHLSIVEHGAYLLMLQHFYATEKPLPVGKALHRLLRAESKADRDAIDTIASQFWTVTEAGLINKRAVKEFARAEEIAATNRAIAVAREARKRAAKEARNEHETSTKRAQTVHEQSTNQTPDTRHQTKEQTLAPAFPDAEGGTSPGALSRALRERGIESNPMEPRMLAFAAAGITPKLAAAAADEARRSKGDGVRIPPGYVYSILDRWLSDPSSRPASAYDPDAVAAEAIRIMAERGQHATQ